MLCTHIQIIAHEDISVTFGPQLLEVLDCTEDDIAELQSALIDVIAKEVVL